MTATSDWRARARALKATDPERSNASIARELGVATSQVWRAVNPERARELTQLDNSRRNKAKRAWENEHDRGVCACGATMSVGADRHEFTQCQACHNAAKRAARLVRADVIEDLWADGRTMNYIAAAVGLSRKAIGVEMWRLRREGLADLPLRYVMRDGQRVAA